jgi:hypothetical protein
LNKRELDLVGDPLDGAAFDIARHPETLAVSLSAIWFSSEIVL